jgi:cytochrome P450
MSEKVDTFASFDPKTLSEDQQLALLRNARATDPVARSEELDCWVLTRHADVDYGLRTYTDLCSTKWQDEDGVWHGGDRIPALQAEPFLVLETDPPVWRDQRGLLHPFFTPKAARARQPWIEALVDSLLDEVLDTGEIDLARQLAYAVPTLTTLKLLGLRRRNGSASRPRRTSSSISRRAAPSSRRATRTSNGARPCYGKRSSTGGRTRPTT